VLKVVSIKKSFGRNEVLKGTCMEIGPEVMVLIGPNGSGKSTLLKIIAGILDPDEGIILINDEDITTSAVEARRVGYVPQAPALFNHLNIRNNIRYSMRNGWGSEEAFDKAIKMLGLSKVLGEKPSEISGGYKSRVSLARALTLKPKVMLLDEPFTSIDYALKEGLLCEFREVLAVQQIPVLYVTHDFQEARMLGDQFAVISDGITIKVETADQAFGLVKIPFNRCLSSPPNQGLLLS
jgi:molybdate transport system ATP-binding protein